MKLFVLFTLCTVGHAQRNSAYNAVNNLGIKLYKEAAKDNKDLVISTINVAASLAGLLAGSRGATAGEIKQAFHFQKPVLSQQALIADLQNLLPKINNADAGISFVNVFTVPFTSKVLPEFRSIIEKQLLFRQYHEEDSSNGKLKLENVGKLDGVWKYQFNLSKTKKDAFYVDNGQRTVYVDMMYIKGYFRYIYDVDLDAELVEIPFAGDNLTMVIIKPKRADGLKFLQTNINLGNLNLALTGLGSIGVHLRVPRFNLKSELALKDQLRSLGIDKAFVPGVADLSGIDGTRDLSLLDERQLNTVNITERGSMPAPDTDISDGLAPMDYDEPAMTYFTVDQPFVFLIRHKPTGAILSIGHVNRP